MSRKRWDGSRWTAWTKVGGLLSAAPAASADRAAGTVTVLVRGTDGHIYRIVLSRDRRRRGFTNLGRQTWSGPAAGAGPAARSWSAATARRRWSSRASFATAIGGLLTGAPPCHRSSASYVVLGRGTDGALYAYDGRPGTTAGPRWAARSR